ncbi:MAG TPA: hypothetical protein VLL96_03190 [Candidatus Deferrimicrobiaceae bacterium]|nr:hypothetical protein [Candidatus Deferrimicrobiaceae bacterium]
MLTSATKRYFLPFYEKTGNESEVEAAAVFASAEVARSKGGGLIGRQPQERMEFLAKIGYPIWVYLKNSQVFFLDGFGKPKSTASFLEMPTAKAFIDALEANSNPRENYEVFLADQANYFQQNVKEKKFTFEGLIADQEFRQEFEVYRKETAEVSSKNWGLLLPSLDEATISAQLSELDKLKNAIREDAQRLPECLRLINKTTGQFITEIDYESAASTEEADAKIKAQEQIVNPQIALLNKNYTRKMKAAKEGFDRELDSLQKQKTKTIQYIRRNQEETKKYIREAKAHANKGHKVYEKRWKEKIRKAQKELNALEKEIKNIENNAKKLTSQKTQAISNLVLELDQEVKLARQPILELEAEREGRIQYFKREAQKLILQEKPVVESIKKALSLHDEATTNLEALSVRETVLKDSALFFVPFYVASYQGGSVRRYRVFSPSKISSVDFSAKLRGALGISKAKDLLVPRFKAIATLISHVEVYVNENPVFERQLWELGQRFDLLRNSEFQEKTRHGLGYLVEAGWLLEREKQELSNRLRA